MDHAWIPGGDPPSLMAKQLCSDRVLAAISLDTHVVTNPAVKLMTDLYTELEFTSTVVKPIGDLVLISHGNDSGWLSLDLDSAAGTTTNYAELKTILDPANVHRKTALRIPPTLYTPTGGTPGPTRVLLGGCRVGKAPKFVDALKDVLGGVVPIVAPRHFHMYSPLIRRQKVPPKSTFMGTYEFLCYAFEATSLTRLDSAGLLKAMHDNPKNLTIDGNAVAPATWKAWLGKNFHAGRGTFDMPVKVPLGRTIDKQTELSPGQLRHRQGTYTARLTNPTPAQRTETGLKAALSQYPAMQAAWGFPEYEQYGHDTFDQFFASFTWKASDPKADPVVWVGSREEYLMLVPVTSMLPADHGKLFYNFFPPRSGSTLSAFKELDETDSRLYYRTP